MKDEATRSGKLLVVAAASLLLLPTLTLLRPVSLHAQDGTQKTFATAAQAVEALVMANRNNDVSALGQILGAEASTLISSGDDTQDKNDRATFVALYDAHHRLVSTRPGNMTLLVGKNEWPLPLRLTKSDGAWRFDSADGIKEILYRRIGSNELAAIKVCQALRQAQVEYAQTGHDGIPPESMRKGFGANLESRMASTGRWPKANRKVRPVL